MRHIFLLIAAVFVFSSLHAQVGVKVNFNVGSQPAWGPTGYDYVEYYYLPDIETYYNVPQHKFYYNEGGHWVGRSHLPARYHDYDLYNSHKVVVNEREPFRHDQTYRDQYSSFKNHNDQESIRNSHDPKYFVNKNHPEHNNWLKQQKHDNGNGKGKGRDNKHDEKKGQDKHGD